MAQIETRHAQGFGGFGDWLTCAFRLRVRASPDGGSMPRSWDPSSCTSLHRHQQTTDKRPSYGGGDPEAMINKGLSRSEIDEREQRGGNTPVAETTPPARS